MSEQQEMGQAVLDSDVTPAVVMESPVWVMRGGAYLLDEYAGVLIDSAGNYSVKTRGNPRALVAVLRAIAEEIEEKVAGDEQTN
ncbi:hypothetical protein MUN76_15185 [Leucobacter rhizosphaerae]|uniref:Uncharacterized protein n=1 Tax=Leucobacter rhizosphaerae TaxID=2932245 RepID=A0ABY4FVR9_9MICO|nr:hypothetical protein [Leucobacter rhizosphaerae]UOQ60353.1 hypothetical protein MUN76_15185 [Leucobacter rhizosphaerae]